MCFLELCITTLLQFMIDILEVRKCVLISIAQQVHGSSRFKITTV